jgi:glucose-1-phosphate cytidylyltransferase
LDLDGVNIQSFREKSKKDVGWINGGFMVLEPSIFDYIEGDDTIFERGPLEILAAEGHLDCYKHEGFWQCMDTLRDKEKLERMISEDRAPWKWWK